MTTLGNAVLNVVLNPGQFLSQLTNIQAATTVAVGAMGAAFGAFVNTSVNKAADFEEQMSGVAAAAGAPADQLERLKQAAIDAGASTSFSATGAAQAMEEMAKAGLDVNTILSGGLAGTLGLAAATGIKDLGYAAEVSADALNTFGLSGDKMGMVADVITNAANKSSMTVEQWRSALQSVGPVIAANGISVQEFSGFLSMMSTNAVKGADAGQGLKSMLMQMQSPSKQAAAMMKEIGLSAYDSSGHMKKLDVLFADIQKSFAGMSEQQKNLYGQTIMGAGALNTLNVVLKEGGEGMREWTDKMNETGTAATTAQTRMDNLRGAQEQLSGATESLQIVFGQIFLPMLARATNSLTDVVNSITAFVSWAIKAGAEVKKFMAPLTDWISKNKALQIGLEGLKVAVATLAGLAGFMLLRNALVAMATTIRGMVLPALTSLYTALGPLLIPLAAVAAAVAALYLAYKYNFMGIKDVIDNFLRWVGPALKTIPIWFNALVKAGGILKDGIQGVFFGISVILGGFQKVVQGAIVIPASEMYRNTVKWFGEMRAGIAEAVGGVVSFVVGKFAAIGNGIGQGLASAGRVVNAFITGLGNMFRPLGEFLASIGVDIGAGLSKLVGSAVDYFSNLARAGQQQMQQARAEAERQRQAAAAEAERARAQAAAKEKAAAAASRAEFMKTHPLVQQGLQDLQAGATAVRSSVSSASSALSQLTSTTSAQASRIIANGMKTTTAQVANANAGAKVIASTGQTAGTAVANAAGTATRALGGTSAAAKATSAEVEKLLPQANKLVKAYNDAVKSGNKDAIGKAALAIKNFRDAHKGAGDAISIAKDQLREHSKAASVTTAQIAKLVPRAKELQHAFDEATRTNNPAAIRSTSLALDEFKRKTAGASDALTIANRELDAQKRAQEQAAAKAKAHADTIQKFKDQLTDLNARMRSDIKDGKVTQNQYDDWANAYTRIAREAGQAGISISQVAGNLTSENKGLLAKASAAVAATKASEALHQQNLNTIKFLPTATDARLKELTAIAKQTKNTELLKAVQEEQGQRAAKIQSDTSKLITDAQSQVTNAVNETTSALEKQAAALEAQAKKAPAQAAKLRALAAELRALDQYNNDNKSVEKTADRSKDLLKTSESKIDEGKSTLAGGDKANDIDKLVSQIQAQITAEGELQSLLQKRIALKGPFTALYQSQLSNSQNLTSQLQAQAAALGTLNQQLKDHAKAVKIADDSASLLSKAEDELANGIQGQRDGLYGLADQLRRQAELDGAHAQDLLTQADLVEQLADARARLKEAGKDELDTKKLLERADNAILDLTDQNMTATDKLIVSLRAQAETDTENAAALLARADALDEAAAAALAEKKAEEDRQKVAREAEQLAERSTNLMADYEEAIENVGVELSSYEKMARQAEAQAALDPANSDLFLEYAQRLRQAGEEAEQFKISADSQDMIERMNESLDTAGEKLSSFQKDAAKARAQAILDPANAVELEALALRLEAADKRVKALTKSEEVQKRSSDMIADATQAVADANEQLAEGTDKAVTSLEKKARTLIEQAALETANAQALRAAITAGADNAVELEAQAVASDKNATALTAQATAIRTVDSALTSKKETEDRNKLTTDILEQANGKLTEAYDKQSEELDKLEKKLRDQAQVDAEHKDVLLQKADAIKKMNDQLKKTKEYGTWGGFGKFVNDFKSQLKDADQVGNALSQLGKAVLSGMGTLNNVVQGFMQGGPLGALVALITQSKTFANLLAILNPIVQTAADAVGMFLEPLIPIFQVLSTALLPVLKVFATIMSSLLIPVFQLLFPIIKFFGIVLLNVAKFVANIWNALANTVNRLLGWAGVKLGNINVGDFDAAIAALSGLTWDAAMAAGKAADANKDFSDTVKDSTKAVNDIAESLSNVPSGFIAPLARWRASEQIAGSGPGATLNQVSNNSNNQKGGTENNYVIENVEVRTEDPATLFKRLKEFAESEQARVTGNFLTRGRIF